MIACATKATKATTQFVVIIPAAGVGKRMKAHCPKQYLSIQGKTILEHTVHRLLSHPLIEQVVLPLSENDEYFQDTALVNNPNVTRVAGGVERVDSVLNGLKVIDSDKYPWVLVHDAARPCLTHEDINELITTCIDKKTGGLLAFPVRDTMKKSLLQSHNGEVGVDETIDRSTLWHALTPQMYQTQILHNAIEHGLSIGANLTDESSAVEAIGEKSLLVEGRSDNIKITRPDDLAMAEFILMNQNALPSTVKQLQIKES